MTLPSLPEKFIPAGDNQIEDFVLIPDFRGILSLLCFYFTYGKE
tara:strand:+ start:20754 stop:20885 length:132 start_codon:yes stop_codon:yes gene_type:complete